MTFYFYDLETSGLNPRAQRIMQFAGQRTDKDLNPIGEPDNWLIKLTEEVLPDPEAILVTGITPQKTLAEGYTEAEFLKLFFDKVCQPDTVIAGFNNVRFDDEFMRTTLWRNFYDPYEWQYQNGCSRWDLMDVVRMVRALRPDGIKWPFAPARRSGLSDHGQIIAPKEGDVDESTLVPTNRLELITELNEITHDSAHDALSDVYATIAVAKLIKDKQPKMFDYLLSMRSKKEVAKLTSVNSQNPFLYTSGRYSSSCNKTTAVVSIADADHGNILVFDLSIDPNELFNLNDKDLSDILFTRNPDTDKLAVKTLKINCCPAVAPIGVLDKTAEDSIGLTKSTITKNYNALIKNKDFTKRVKRLHDKFLETKKSSYKITKDPDFQIYDGFVDDEDKKKQRLVRSMDAQALSDYHQKFNDKRLSELLVRYKAKNYPSSLSADELDEWNTYKTNRILNGINGQLSVVEYDKKISELKTIKTDTNSSYLLDELILYAQSIVPLQDY